MRGRPRIDSEEVSPRLSRVVLDQIDAYIARQPDPKPSRPDVIRLALRDWLADQN